MNTKKISGAAALVASAASLTVVPAAVAGSSLPKVHVRVEGISHTLLLGKLVRPNGKAVRRGAHSCSGKTAIDPFTVATRGRWSGPWYSGLGWEPDRVLGEHDDYTKTKTWFELFVDNRAASVGLCSLKLKRGEHILLAAVPDSGTEYPSTVTAPAKATLGVPFTVTVVSHDAKGKAHALKGATVKGGGLKATTNAKGRATLVPTHTGKLVLTATRKGEIRSEAAVRVTT